MKRNMPYSIKELEKQAVEDHVRDTLKDMYEFQSVLKPDLLEVFVLDIANVPMTEICKRLQISRHTGISRLNKAQRAVALAKPDSPIAQGREGVQRLIPESVKTLGKGLKDYGMRPGLALKTATEVLKGTQVLIPKEERSSVKETVETKRMIMIERLEIATQFGAQAPESEQLEANRGLIEASDGQLAGVESLKSSPERPDPTPGEADQGGADVSEIGASESDHQN